MAKAIPIYPAASAHTAQLDLRHFRYFVAVAEELHFGRAARRLHMAQPPLSQQIKWLEDELGVRLFHRNTHHVSLTEAGRIFLKEARRVLCDVERAVRIARQAGEGTAGHLVVGFHSQFDGGVISMVKAALEAAFPELVTRFAPMDTMAQLAALKEGRIRVGITGVPIDEEDVAVEAMMRPPLVVAMPEGHALAGRRSLKLADLANERFVAFSRDMNPWIRDLLERRCRESGFTLQVAQESNSPMSMEGFVAAGTGICILPAWVASGRKGVARRPLEEGELPIDLAMITLRGQDSPVLRKLREALLAALRESIAEAE